MTDLVTAAATIQGAQIQANYSLLAAIIGAVGIILAAWLAWRNGMKLHQHNNIIEAKRDVYLDTVAKYQQLVSDYKLLIILPEKLYEILLNNNREFHISINKVRLICDPKNKEMVNDFQEDVNEHIAGLFTYFDCFINSHKSLIAYQGEVKLKRKERDDLTEKYPDNFRGLSFNGDEVSEKISILNNRLVVLNGEYQACQVEYDYNKEQAIEKTQQFENELNLKYIEFSKALRAELMIKS